MYFIKIKTVFFLNLNILYILKYFYINVLYYMFLKNISMLYRHLWIINVVFYFRLIFKACKVTKPIGEIQLYRNLYFLNAIYIQYSKWILTNRCIKNNLLYYWFKFTNLDKNYLIVTGIGNDSSLKQFTVIVVDNLHLLS